MGRVAYFVSPHGLGHAARACAVMAEMGRRRPEIQFDIFTQVPHWFFSESLSQGFTYHRLASDVGLVQRSPLVEDLRATADRLDEELRDRARLGRVVESLRGLGCVMVVADISPLGLEAAAAVSVPSVLIENFTWDWIYRNYPGAPQRLRDHGRRMSEIFGVVDLRIQTKPVCELQETAVRVPPVARLPGLDRCTVRRRLGVPASGSMVVVSMGGVPWDYGGFSDLEHRSGPWIVVPGGSENGVQRQGRLLLLPFHADIYHPDLVAAADVVVSKLGYSTVAETYQAGASLAYITRPRFPESPVLEQWAKEQMNSDEIREQALSDGAWLGAVEGLLETPRRKPVEENGAEKAAEIILEEFAGVLR